MRSKGPNDAKVEAKRLPATIEDGDVRESNQADLTKSISGRFKPGNHPASGRSVVQKNRAANRRCWSSIRSSDRADRMRAGSRWEDQDEGAHLVHVLRGTSLHTPNGR